MNKVYVLFICFIFSCQNDRFKKFESNWVVYKYEVNGVDELEDILFYNFTIDIKDKTSIPVSIRDRRVSIVDNTFPIRFILENENTIMEISNHPIFSGKYKIQCLDLKCCSIRLENDTYLFEMKYNGDLPFGRSRECP